MATPKYGAGQYVCWQTPDGASRGDGIIEECVCGAEGVLYKVGHAWVAEEIITGGVVGAPRGLLEGMMRFRYGDNGRAP